MKKICRLAMVLGTVAVFGFLGCTALTGNNKSGTTQSGTEGNTGGNENGNNTGENNQTQTVDLSTALSSFTEDEITALEESINTQILSSTNGVTGITATIDADKNLSLTYGGNASVAITPVLTDDGAIKLLETYANKSTVIAAKKTELKNTAENFTLPNGLSQKLEGNAADLKAFVKLLIENIPPEKFAYDLGSRAIYLKMSDLDSTSLPEATEDGATVIPGVKRIKKNGRIALDFTELTNADIKLDFEKANIDVSKYYRGGFIFGDDTNIDILGDTKIFFYAPEKSDFENIKNEERSILNILQRNTQFSNLRLELSDNNIYGLDLDKIYEKNKENIEFFKGKDGELKYDAKEALTETSSKRMFDDSGNLHSDISTNSSLMEKISINPEFASYLIKNGVSLKNVIIEEGTWTHITESQGLGTIANSVVNAGMSGEDKANVKGIVRFNGKSPKTFATDLFSKIIIGENGYNNQTVYEDSGRYDISRLGVNQETIIKKKQGNYLYLSTAYSSETPIASQTFIFSDGTYNSNMNGGHEFPNSVFEKHGNGETVSDTDGETLTLGKGTLSSKSQARANNIKLTPIQKLLLDDQHIYG
ncbi:MAG: hypothetical protein IKP60_08030 [Treponema sp.]|nr:hypothetical protein [Treponema sp.]